MVKVFVKGLGLEEKTISRKSGNVSELLSVLGTNDDSVILVGEGGKIYTKDTKISDNSRIKIIEVFSGG